MQLKTLVAGIPLRQVIGTLDRPVESIAYDSRRAQRNGLFVALRGGKSDGHQFGRRRNRLIYRSCSHKSRTPVVELRRWKFLHTRSRRTGPAVLNGMSLSSPISPRTISIFTARWRAISIPKRSSSHNLETNKKNGSLSRL